MQDESRSADYALRRLGKLERRLGTRTDPAGEIDHPHREAGTPHLDPERESRIRINPQSTPEPPRRWHRLLDDHVGFKQPALPMFPLSVPAPEHPDKHTGPVQS